MTPHVRKKAKALCKWRQRLCTFPTWWLMPYGMRGPNHPLINKREKQTLTKNMPAILGLFPALPPTIQTPDPGEGQFNWVYLVTVTMMKASSPCCRNEIARLRDVTGTEIPLWLLRWFPHSQIRRENPPCIDGHSKWLFHWHGTYTQYVHSHTGLQFLPHFYEVSGMIPTLQIRRSRLRDGLRPERAWRNDLLPVKGIPLLHGRKGKFVLKLFA